MITVWPAISKKHITKPSSAEVPHHGSPGPEKVVLN